MQDFRKLDVWAKAHATVLEVYKDTSRFPPSERYGITAQLRRSAASVPANLAEGCGRGSDGSFASFVQIAFGSACETEYHILLSRDLGYLEDESYTRLSRNVTQVKRMLTALLRTLQTSTARRRRS